MNTTTDKTRKRALNSRVVAWVLSCLSCMFVPHAVHGQNTCMGATMQLQNYAQQVQVVAYNYYYSIQSQCAYCGYNVYCQQNCQAHFVQLNQWYYYQMQQIGYWYDAINVECARGRARSMPNPDIVARGHDGGYGDNRRLDRRLADLERKVEQVEDDDGDEGGDGDDVIVDIVIPRAPSGIGQ